MLLLQRYDRLIGLHPRALVAATFVVPWVGGAMLYLWWVAWLPMSYPWPFYFSHVALLMPGLASLPGYPKVITWTWMLFRVLGVTLPLYTEWPVYHLSTLAIPVLIIVKTGRPSLTKQLIAIGGALLPILAYQGEVYLPLVIILTLTAIVLSIL